jgi:dihydroxyacetone kinase-like protein
VKKILNQPSAYVDEMLDGLCTAYPEHYTLASARVLARKGGARPGKVGVVTGGGSGHLPVFLGYVGQGLLDACAVGNVFAGPRVSDCVGAIEAADGGVGVLALYGNYGGDRMNFEMAQEQLESDTLPLTSVRVADDVASASVAERDKRRGVAGMVLAFKVAGACAAAGYSLAVVTQVASKAAQACRSIGVALTPCTVPESGKASFQISDAEIEFGMGIHGEPGLWRGPVKSADALTDEMLDLLLPEVPLSAGDRAAVLVNSLGATPHEELFIVYRRVAKILTSRGVKPVMPLIGRYATSMEMTGLSLTLMPLDSELETLLTAPADCPFWKV